MGLQPAERPGPLPRAVRQDARHQTLVVVVENRLGNPAAEGKGRIVPVQPSRRRRRRAGRNKAGIAVRKRHDEKMRAMHDAGNDRIRLAKVRLGMTRRVRQRHEHLPQTKVPFANVILHDRLLARAAMFVTKTLEDPLRRVPLLAVNRAILFQNAVDDIRERRQLRALRRLAVADIPAVPNATVSWQPSCDRSRTGEKLPVGSNPHDDTPVALVDKDPLRTSPTFHQVNPDKGYRAPLKNAIFAHRRFRIGLTIC